MNSQCLFTQTVPAWPTCLCRQVTGTTRAQLELTVLCLQPVCYFISLQGGESEGQKTSKRSQPCRSPGSRWMRKGHSLERALQLSRVAREPARASPPLRPSDGWRLPSELPPRHPARHSSHALRAPLGGLSSEPCRTSPAPRGQTAPRPQAVCPAQSRSPVFREPCTSLDAASAPLQRRPQWWEGRTSPCSNLRRRSFSWSSGQVRDARPVALVPRRPRSGLGSHFRDVNVKFYGW